MYDYYARISNLLRFTLRPTMFKIQAILGQLSALNNLKMTLNPKRSNYSI